MCECYSLEIISDKSLSLPYSSIYLALNLQLLEWKYTIEIFVKLFVKLYCFMSIVDFSSCILIVDEYLLANCSLCPNFEDSDQTI
jgi:hypothetical protein